MRQEKDEFLQLLLITVHYQPRLNNEFSVLRFLILLHSFYLNCYPILLLPSHGHN